MSFCIACGVTLTPANELRVAWECPEKKERFVCSVFYCINIVYTYDFPACKKKIA